MDVRGKVKTLEQLRHLRGEVDMLSQRIAELELAARGGAGRITGMPRASRRRDRTGDMAVQLSLLWDRLEARRARCMDLLGVLYAFIDDIDDSLMRQIMTYRYIDGDTWQMIAARIGEWDEQYPRRLHNRFLAQSTLPASLSGEREPVNDAKDTERRRSYGKAE